ncbi:MAG: hypothetical protein ABI632_13105, partial [Pseudolysinimonas sp.]
MSAVGALARRLHAVAPFLLESAPHPELSHGPLLAALADDVAARPTRARVWLLATAVAGGYPTRAEVDQILRGLDLAAPGAALGAVLSGVAQTAATQVEDELELEVVDGGVVVDVDFCAKSPHNTGIQRVVRSAMPHWDADTGAVFVAWSGDITGYRRLTEGQRRLALDWHSGDLPATQSPDPVLVVPWNSELVIPDVPAAGLIERQAAIARDSGNRVVLIGHDAIPIVSADTMVDEESDRFSQYLSIVKNSAVVAANSATTAEEFTGFVDTLPAQGLVGPRVQTVR